MNKVFDNLRLWKNLVYCRKNYATTDREPFFDLVIPYFPNDKEGVIVDIGAGEGDFASHLGLCEKYNNVFFLEGNIQTVESLKKKNNKALLYQAPDRLPFEDNTVSLVHCSHMVEHLHHSSLHPFLEEVNRVLKFEGVLVISTPLLWDCFYGDLSHVKPYNPEVFMNYLCNQSSERTGETISHKFTVKKLAFRYATKGFGEWGANSLVIDFFFQVFRCILNAVGLNKYVKNGYTLILHKSNFSV